MSITTLYVVPQMNDVSNENVQFVYAHVWNLTRGSKVGSHS